MNQDMTSMLLFTLTALIFTGAWVIGRMKRRDEQMETLLDRLERWISEGDSRTTRSASIKTLTRA